MPWWLILHAAVTWALCGIIWFIQIVQYPLLRRSAGATFCELEAAHVWRSGLVIGPIALVEAITAMPVSHFLWRTHPALDFALILCLVAIWLSTFFAQVPLHLRLLQSYDRSLVEKLILTNWLRTVAWSVRGCLLAGVLSAAR